MITRIPVKVAGSFVDCLDENCRLSKFCRNHVSVVLHEIVPDMSFEGDIFMCSKTGKCGNGSLMIQNGELVEAKMMI